MDSQANATHGLGIRVSWGAGDSRGLAGRARPRFGDSRRPRSPGSTWLLPPRTWSAPGCFCPPSTIANSVSRKALASLEPGRYSFVFIDCPPSLGLLTVNALVAAESVLIPVQAEYFALEGLAQLLSTVSAIQERLNPSLRVAGLVLTMVDLRTGLARQVEQQIRGAFPTLTFKTVVPRNVRLAEAPSHGIPVSMLDPRCAGSDAYFDLALEVISHG